jgi:glycosyltransferase involved in cell wall biosynthesis
MSMPPPLVTIIIPCRNEEDWIGPCLDSIIQNDYPKDRLEVLVVDGMSSDDTRAALQPFLEQHSFIRLLNNPRKTTPAALNVGITAARGDFIMRVDAHYEYPANYVSRLVYWLEESKADNVGGLLQLDPATPSPMARAMAVGVTNPFGIGNAYYRLGVSEPRAVDTVPFGCYRRDVFDRIGKFDEDLLRNQDLEFNLRLRKEGGRILLVPDVVIRGQARDSLRQLIRLYYQYGYFNPLVIWRLRGRANLRQIVTPVFVLSLLVTGILAPWFPWLATLFLAILGSYLIMMIANVVAVAVKHGVACALRMPLVFVVMHFSHGYGFLRGCLDLIVLGRGGRSPVADIPLSRGKIVLLARREATRKEEAAPRQVSTFPATKLMPGHLPIPAITSPELPKVSVIVPCRNEVRWIAECLESIAHNDYPKDRLEVFIVDGMSDDGTRPIVQNFAAGHPWLRMLDNPKRITPTALNLGIAASQGEVIIRMDAHNDYPANYISALVYWLNKSGADDVGGLWITHPSGETPKARALALGESHPFGVGNAHYRLGVLSPCWVDTVPFGCYRREVFDRIGTFDEELMRHQDIELNLRLRRAGGTILLVPEVASYYHPRESLQKLWRTHFQNGYFSPLVARKMGGIITVRQLIPPVFVVVLAGSALLAPFSHWMLLLCALTAITYLIPLVVSSVLAAFRHGVRCGLWLALVFMVLHFANGCGAMRGMVDFIFFRRHITERSIETIPITR